MKMLPTAFFIMLTVCSSATAQEALREAITAAIQARLGNSYHLGSIANLDSLSPADGFEDPYRTLTGCTIFVVLGVPPGDGHFPRGAVGIYRTQELIWLSDTLVNLDENSDARIHSTQDLNDDGTVDIITAWAYGMHNPVERYWIFGWTGQVGNLISAVDSAGTSVISGQEGTLQIVDVNGDGSYELQCSIPDFSNGVDSIAIYGWNGVAFVPMQGLGGTRTTAPRDAVYCTVHASVKVAVNGLKYDYVVDNSPVSHFNLDEFNLEKKSGDFRYASPLDWEFGPWDAKPLVGWQSNQANPLRRGQTQVFSFFGLGLPTIVPFYAQGYNYLLEEEPPDAEAQYQDAVGNAFVGTTIGPMDTVYYPQTNAILDSLTSYAQRAQALGWIRDSLSWHKYTSFLDSIRSVLDSDVGSARRMLQTMLREVQEDSGTALSSEAYALLKYNGEYLLGRLGSASLPVLSTLSPEMTLTRSGSFPLVVKGTGFVQGAEILWNGSPRPTTYVSSRELNVRIPGADIATPRDVPVSMRNPDGARSDSLIFSAVDTLPAPVTPMLECVTRERSGGFTAWFGYKNDNTRSVYIPPGRMNNFTPAPKNRSQATVFQPGRKTRVFGVAFPGDNLRWMLNDRIITASKNSSRCR